MIFKIVCFLRKSFVYPVFDNKRFKTDNDRTGKYYTHANGRLFYLQAAIFMALFNNSVDGESTLSVTPIPIDMDQVLMKPYPLRRQGAIASFADMTGRPGDDQGQAAALKRFSTIVRKSTSRKRTTMWFESAVDHCDYLALNCFRAYQTGKVCARTLYYTYFTFKNYCMMDYANCASRYEMWQAIHMGDCVDIRVRSSNVQMSEQSSRLMDEIYVVEQDFGI